MGNREQLEDQPSPGLDPPLTHPCLLLLHPQFLLILSSRLPVLSTNQPQDPLLQLPLLLALTEHTVARS